MSTPDPAPTYSVEASRRELGGIVERMDLADGEAALPTLLAEFDRWAFRIGEQEAEIARLRAELDRRGERITELEADVVRLGTNSVESLARLKLALAGHVFDGESLNTREAIRHELIVQGQEAAAERDRLRSQRDAALALADEAEQDQRFAAPESRSVTTAALRRALTEETDQ